MERLKQIRKELCISQIKVAEYLKIKQYTYSRMENSTCDDETRNKILQFFISECNNLDISKKRLSDILGIHRNNIYKYKGDTKKVLESEREKRMQLKMELYNMLKQ